MAGSKCDDVERFLDNLSPSTSKYTYKGKEQFDQILQNEYHRRDTLSARQPFGPEISEYFVIFIDPSTFEQDFLVPDPVASLRLSYNAALHTLILRMTTPEYGQVAYALQTEVAPIFQSMGLHRAVEGFGNVDINVGGGSVKQPDWGWGPFQPPHGTPRRPGVVLEVSVSETETKLRDDARMWADPLRGQANMAITIKVSREKPEFNIDTWEWDSGAQCSLVTQSCVIGKIGDKVIVSQYPITIPFDYIFQRDPQLPGKTDIRLEEENLVNLATMVWDTQDLWLA